ncbi:glycosyltransferase, family 1 [Halarcobacter ebronensis]|nr:glycosyltransferase, family 1 [Halarcobacter ebronensis]
MKNNTLIICLSPNRGGMEISSLKLASKLESYVNIFFLTRKSSFIDSNLDKYLNNSLNNKFSISFSSNLSIKLIFLIRKIVKSKNIKNVIFFGASEIKSLYFAFLGLNINFIVRHATTKLTSKRDFIHKLLYSNVNYHVAISEHLKENVKKIVPLNNHCEVKVIYPSIKIENYDFNNILSSRKRNEKIRIIHTGRIIKGKGQLDAILACEILYKNNIEFDFFILGSFENGFEIEFKKVYEKLKYKDSIHLIGFEKDIFKYLMNSDIFLFPSYGEGFCNSYAEALSCGLYCISYENTTFIEFKKLGFINALSKNKDIELLKDELYKAVFFISSNDTYRQKNLDLAKHLFSVDSEVNGYLKLLK